MDIIEKVLNIAYAEMKEGGSNKKETEGQNRGPQVRRYLSAVGITWAEPWCAAFVSYCINKACEELSLRNLVIMDSYCPNIARWGKGNNVYSLSPEKGDIFFVMDDHPTEPWKHTGFITGVASANAVRTIEGNTNNDGSANGDGIYERVRDTSNLSFVKWWKLFPSDTGIPIVFEGKELCKGILKDNKTYVPIREMCEAMGYKVIYTNDKIVIQKGVK